MSAILEVKDLQTSYGAVKVLAGVSFTVEQGETYAMVGESGSGKTTVIRAIAGLAPAHRPRPVPAARPPRSWRRTEAA